MADIKHFLVTHLLEPLKQYPTVIQDTMIEIIAQKLQLLYDYAAKFPEILSPNQSRMDILQAIADQFLFTVREDADIQEQVDILDHILYVYSKRGSIDTIENMWKYYGGKLPKDVKVIIPSYNLFRYSISKLSGTHRFINGRVNSVILDTKAPITIPRGTIVYVKGSNRYRITTGIQKDSSQIFISTIDGLKIGDILVIENYYEGKIIDISENKLTNINRTGAYEIRLTNNTYPIPDLREFLLKELVAAGNYIYFTNTLYLDITSSIDISNYYKYSILNEDLLQIQLSVLKTHQGLNWSGINQLSRKSEDSAWSGRGSIYLELTKLLDLDLIDLSVYTPYNSLGVFIDILPNIGEITYSIGILKDTRLDLNTFLYCTSTYPSYQIERYLYNSQGEIINSDYPGYFILGVSLLGEEVI